jgi:HAE1 family hydrophobic/amphiphilic exporter-1/multidrug efflux pump
VVALTLTPALCALILKPGAENHHAFFTWFNAAFLRLTKRYTNGVSFFLRRQYWQPCWCWVCWR